MATWPIRVTICSAKGKFHMPGGIGPAVAPRDREASREPPLPPWHRAYALFRVADGATSSLIPLLMVVHYGFPAWGVAAAAAVMNLVGVPATYLWGALIEDGKGRRRLATMGFAAAAVGLAAMAFLPPWPGYLAAAALFTAFGVATAPAAGRLILEDRARGEWSHLTSRLNATLSWTYLVGMVAVIAWSLSGTLDLRVVFAMTAALCAGAAVLAWIFIPKWQAMEVPEPDLRGTTHQRFERPVWFPWRLRVRLRWPGSSDRQWLGVGIVAMFFGTTMFMSTYSGVLADDLSLSIGLVLLAQGPGHVAIPLAFGACSRLVRRHGELAVGRLGMGVRILIIPAMAATILWWRPPFYGLLLALGMLLGAGFALMQSTLPVMAAASHPRSAGRGMGGYHAAVSLGVLAGSLAGFLSLLLLGLAFSYAVASLSVIGGTVLTLAVLRRMSTTSAKNGQPT